MGFDLKTIKGYDDVMDFKAMSIVRSYIDEHFDKSETPPEYTVFTVWKNKVLQNWKYLISSSISDGKYYELTYNGNRGEWYLDCYVKLDNQCIVID